MDLTIKKSILVDKFLTPISKLADRCILSITDESIKCKVFGETSSPVLFTHINTETDIGDEETIDLNLPDVPRFIRLLNCITSDEITITVNSNNIVYESPSIRWKYHLLEEGIIDKDAIPDGAISKLTYDSNFLFEKEVMGDISRGGSNSVDTDKLYFYMKDGNVYSEIGDKKEANVDSIRYLVTDTYGGKELTKPIVLSLNKFKMLSSLGSDMSVKINTEKQCMLFKYEEIGNYELKYIFASEPDN